MLQSLPSSDVTLLAFEKGKSHKERPGTKFSEQLDHYTPHSPLDSVLPSSLCHTSLYSEFTNITNLHVLKSSMERTEAPLHSENQTEHPKLRRNEKGPM